MMQDMTTVEMYKRCGEIVEHAIKQGMFVVAAVLLLTQQEQVKKLDKDLDTFIHHTEQYRGK